MNILGMGPLEILLIALVAFIFLGPERMSDAARLLGKAIREGRNIASTIPRVVVEDDDIRVVERGRSTSLINDGRDSPTEPEAESQPSEGRGRSRPLLSGRLTEPQGSDAADSQPDGPAR